MRRKLSFDRFKTLDRFTSTIRRDNMSAHFEYQRESRLCSVSSRFVSRQMEKQLTIMRLAQIQITYFDICK